MLKKLLPLASLLAVVATVALTLFLMLARWHWVPELFTHFRILYALGFGLLLAVVLLQRRWWSAGLVALCLLLQLGTLAPHYLLFYKDRRAGQGEELKVISYNLLSRNTEAEAVNNFLRKEDADVVLLLEVNQRWLASLAALDDLYPHRAARPQEGYFGIVLLSKLPITSQEIVQPSLEKSRFLVADLDWDGERVRLFGAHPYTPLGERWAAARNASLAAVKERSQETSGMQIIAGDLNCSAFSPYFRDLRKGLRDSARGRGYSATWRRGHPIWGIPIDHILTSEHLVCTEFIIGPQNGSDHSPLIGRYRRALER